MPSNRSTGRRSATVICAVVLTPGAPPRAGSCCGWAAAPSRLREVLVDERHGHRALADGAGHALDRARAHVAGHKDAGHACLEHVRVAVEWPVRPLHVVAGEDEAARVALDDAGQPVGARSGADEHEAGVDVLEGLALGAFDEQPLEVLILA